MRRVTTIVFILCPLCASASGIGGVKFPEKCGIALTPKQVFDYIFEFAEFQKHVLKTVSTNGFSKHAPNDRVQYVKLMRKLKNGVEDRLLGDDSMKTRDTLHFYADSLRIVQVYRRIAKLLSDEKLLVKLVKAWETEAVAELDESKCIDNGACKRILKLLQEILSAANMKDQVVGSAMAEFSRLAKLANELGGNPTYRLFRDAHLAAAKSAKVHDISVAVRQAVMLSLIRKGESGSLTREDFERNLQTVRGQK